MRLLIPVDDVSAFRAKLDALSLKCLSMGIAAVRLADLGVFRSLIGQEVGSARQYELEWPEVRIGGWRLVGRILAGAAGQPVSALCISTIDQDVDSVARYGMSALHCDHCGVGRRRREVFVFRDLRDGQYKTIGRTCVADFCNASDRGAKLVARFQDLWGAIRRDVVVDEKTKVGVTPQEYVADVLFVAHTQGRFVSKAAAGETGLVATADRAWELAKWLAADEQLAGAYRKTRDEMLLKSREILNWAMGRECVRDYDKRLAYLAGQRELSAVSRDLAILASAVSLHKAWVDGVLRVSKVSSHVGQVGQELSCVVTVVRVIVLTPRQNEDGGVVQKIVLMNDQNGNHINWKTSSTESALLDGLGKEFSIHCWVKEHAHYRGDCQTHVSHVTILG